MQKHLPFWGLLLAIFTLLCGINYVRYGMFTDGILYAAIAKNMAMGQGTFWAPVFSETSGVFLGHPPLHFFLESLFFRVFGEGYLTERLYCLASALLVSFMIHRIWQQYLPKYKALSFVPLLFFFLIEDVFLTYTYNLIECTLTLFTTASFLCVISILQGKKSSIVIVFITFVTALFAAFLSKGPVGLFPLATFGIGWLILRKPSLKNAVFWTVGTVIALVVVFLVLLQFDAPNERFTAYWQEQIIGSMNAADTSTEGVGNMRGHRLHILKRWFDKMLAVLIMVVLILGLAYRKGINLFCSETAKRSLVLLLLGLAGTLPYTLILKQASYYLVPAYVFFALGFGAFLAPEIERLINKIKVESIGFKVFQGIVGVALIAVFVYLFTQIGETDRRDKKLLGDVNKISKIVPRGSIINVKTMKPQFSLYHFLERYHDISVEDKTAHQTYLLREKGIDNKRRYNCKEVKLDLELFQLYECKSSILD